MSKKRLNDTAAVIAMNPYQSQSEHYSRTVRKIDNGYVTSHHSYGPNDPSGPTSKEVYSEMHPDTHDGSVVGGESGAMKRAVDCLKGKY